MSDPVQYQVSIAPMMRYTDRHFRYLLRLLSKKCFLYTEMITPAAILQGNRSLDYSTQEHPLGLQLGGNKPNKLAAAAKIAEDMGYDEINLNIGCPSQQVVNGKFGACLMKHPEVVAECMSAIKNTVDLPITIKSRTGLGMESSYEFLHQFVRTVNQSGCQKIIIHARNAILTGLSPKKNRTIPKLQYQTVYRLKHAFPKLTIIINGGITNTAEIKAHLPYTNGVMLGRIAYQDPYFIGSIDQTIFNISSPIPNRLDIALQYIEYMDKICQVGIPAKVVGRHLLTLFKGLPNAKIFRRKWLDAIQSDKPNIKALTEALAPIHAVAIQE